MDPLPTAKLREVYDSEEINPIWKGAALLSVRENPVIRNWVERLGPTTPLAQEIIKYSGGGGEIGRLVVRREQNDCFFFFSFASSATNCQPGRARRNYHLSGSSLSEQLPTTLRSRGG